MLKIKVHIQRNATTKSIIFVESCDKLLREKRTCGACGTGGCD